MLDRLVKAGIEYLFVSNSDNLGATLDVDLLAYFADSGKAFLMEARKPALTLVGWLWGICARLEGVLGATSIHNADPPDFCLLYDLAVNKHQLVALCLACEWLPCKTV